MENMMRNTTKLMLAAGAATLLVLGGVAGLANADDMGGMRHGMRGHGMGGHGMGGHGGMMRGQLERYDANKDGKLLQEEIDQNRTSWHGEFDGDKNSTLSLDEFKNLWLKAKQEEMVREFQFFDRDGNGQVTLDEYKGPMSGLVSEMDRNGDGMLSREDHQRRGGRDRMRRHGMGQGMGQGMDQGQGMGQGMMDDDDNNDQQPAAPAEGTTQQ
jgi:hypothetical protein